TSQIWVKPWDQLRLTLVHRYVDERYQGSDFANNSIQIESYHLVDVLADYQVSPNCRIFARIDNVFDELYAESAFFDTYFPGPGRSLKAGVKFSF
ncbi:MAG: hypothetical protein AAF546_11980, partial [Verrucomicrobiota bacterium]